MNNFSATRTNKTPKPINHTESIIQRDIVAYLQLKKIFCFSVPNERKASPQAMCRLIATGLRPGVSDLILWLGSDTVYMEVKTPTGRQSEAQKRFQRRCDESGRVYVLVRSVDDVIAFLDKWEKER